ncbi:MAG: hypothetical protein KDC80_05180 [Saprospiraceae bacterium]|nr:hypothetical protein [Saprospiraceae bacterium]
MKALFNYPFAIYFVAAITSLGIMIMIDYILGAEAEHLNAWVIVNRLFGNETAIGDSLAIRQFGLMGATVIMLAINSFFGAILIQLVRLFIRFIHS